MKKFCGIESLVVLRRNPDPIVKKIIYGYESGNPYSVDIVYVEHPYGVNDTVVHFLSTLGHLIQRRVNIVHLHGGGVIESLETKLIRARSIFHFHGADLRTNLAKTTWKKMYYNSGLAGADKILVSTPDLFSFLLWKDASERAEFLPNPIDPMVYRSRTEDVEEQIIFLPTRHDEDMKKTSVAFAAWEILRKINSEAKLKTILWGKNSYMFYEKFKDDKRITWLPVLTRRDYLRHLRSSSIVWGQFVLGTGLVELEAMAAGKPVLHFRKPEVYDRDVYGQDLALESYSSPSSVAHATNDLLRNDRERRKMGLMLQQWALKYHSPEVVSQKLHKIYKQIL